MPRTSVRVWTGLGFPLQSEYGLAWAFHQIDIWSKVATAHPIAVELQGIVIKITLLETPDA